MNQEWLIGRVLEDLGQLPQIPDASQGEFLSLAEALGIIDQTIDQVGAREDDVLYAYLRGHRERLAHALSLVPRAAGPDASCLDVGCYGLMGPWLRKYLGYARVVGIEWRPGVEQEVIRRTYELDGETFEQDCHNFDITRSDWPLEERFDTVLLFEVLEHLNSDPMGVMENVGRRLELRGRLVLSVPNATSYKGLKEFLAGMPPWTYWFYQPDLSHEPRHCFEYTPIVFHVLLRAAGFEELAFRCLYAYSEPEREGPILEIAESLGLERELLGDTLIALAERTSSEVPLRHPDVLYDPDGYYQSSFPAIDERLRGILEKARSARAGTIERAAEAREHERELAELRAELQASGERLAGREADLEVARAAGAGASEASARVRIDLERALFTCDEYMRELAELRSRPAPAAAPDPGELEALTLRNGDLEAQVQELLFTCDCYLQQLSDPERCYQVLKEKRLRRMLLRAKSVARRTPVLNTALRPVYRRLKQYVKRHG